MQLLSRTHTTGPDLVAERMRLGVRANEVARALGVSPQRVSELERLYVVPERQVARYLSALAEITDTSALERIGG